MNVSSLSFASRRPCNGNIKIFVLCGCLCQCRGRPRASPIARKGKCSGRRLSLIYMPCNGVLPVGRTLFRRRRKCLLPTAVHSTGSTGVTSLPPTVAHIDSTNVSGSGIFMRWIAGTDQQMAYHNVYRRLRHRQRRAVGIECRQCADRPERFAYKRYERFRAVRLPQPMTFAACPI